MKEKLKANLKTIQLHDKNKKYTALLKKIEKLRWTSTNSSESEEYSDWYTD